MSLPIELSNIFQYKQKSYKMVLILSILDYYEKNGVNKFPLSEISQLFLSYYQTHKDIKDYPPGGNSGDWDQYSIGQVINLLNTPIEALKNILVFDKENKTISFIQEVYMNMSKQIIHELREYAENELNEYNSSLSEKDFSLRKFFTKIMSEYLVEKKKPLTNHPYDDLLRHEIPENMEKLPFINKHVKVSGSVGKGKWADIPWLALMDKRVTTSTTRGVYIVYLFSKNMDRLYLTLIQGTENLLKESGTSLGYEKLEKRKDSIRKLLNIENMKMDNNISLDTKGRGKSYEVSTIAYSEYLRGNLPSEEQLRNDLESLIVYYNKYVNLTLGITENENDSTKVDKDDNMEQLTVKDTIEHIKSYIEYKGFSYPENLVENFYLSLKSKPFVILAGISGTGKTQLVKLFAEALGANGDNGQYKLIPVRPDWNDPSDLIGYKDLSGKFQPGILTQVLLEAVNPANKYKPYFICLDEMNLARVEHYFSDILSLLETTKWRDGEIVTEKLISEASLLTEEKQKFGSLCIPENVYIIGTVNMDETTYPFSKKVLDRANTIEFNYIDLNSFPNKNSEMENIAKLNIKNDFLKSQYIKLNDMYSQYEDIVHETTEKLVEINKIIEPIHAHIGFRIRDAICFYMSYNSDFKLLSPNNAFDLQILQKILPRIQGSNQAVREVLLNLFVFVAPFIKGNIKGLLNGDIDIYKWYEGNKDDTANILYPQTAKKLLYMLRRLDEDGFTSYWIS